MAVMAEQFASTLALVGSSNQRAAIGTPRLRTAELGWVATAHNSSLSPVSGRWGFVSRKQPLVIECWRQIQLVGFLLSSHSAKGSFCELEHHKAAAGRLTLPAITRRWLLRFDFSPWADANGRFMATKLEPDSAIVHDLPFDSPSKS